MASNSVEDGGPTTNAAVSSLDGYERKLVGANFLAQLASGFTLVCAATALIVAVTDDELAGAEFLMASLFFFLWSCAIAYVWRATLLAISLVICLLMILIVLTLVTDPVKGIGANTDSSIQIFFIALSCILPAFLVGRVLVDSWRLARLPANLRNLFIAGDPHRRGPRQLIGLALGIHPICAYIPGTVRRLLAAGLFLLAAIVAGFAIALVMFLVLSSAIFAAVLYGAVFAGIIGLLRIGARRFARVTAENLIERDHRAPILFLRSFKDEQVRLDRSKPGFIRGMLGAYQRPMLDHVLLEEFTPLGPVIAIGMPGRRAPFGAARTYASDDEWRSVVEKFAAAASAIVMVFDDTEGVEWEFTHIMERGHLAKTLFLMPPRFVKRTASSAEVIRRALADNKCALKDKLSEPCIGWYRASQGEMMLLTSQRPNQASYVCALRQFRERDTQFPSMPRNGRLAAAAG
jgi:hypothetical protein